VKRVFGSFNQQIVHHAKNLLEGAGIGVLVRNQHLSSAMGELPPAECEAQVWVLDDEDAGRAESVLKNSLSPQAGPPWSCPACSERIEGQFTQCWRCGAYPPR
jgi:hypothetical protein